jgi:hypothetical protein
MKLLPVLLITLVIALGCNKEQKSTRSEENKKDTITNQQNTSQTKTDPQNASNTDGQNNSSILTNIEYGISKLPPTLKDYEGKIVAMAKWDDKLGANALFITETEEKGGESRHKELYGYHYIINDKENKLVWKINDFIKDCPVDITLNYIDKSISITDLDKNGIGESSFLYRMACKGDVSPDDMKLIMHEGETKFAIRGTMKLQIGNEKPIGGEMKVDASFDKAPNEFVNFAKEQWNKFMLDKIKTD